MPTEVPGRLLLSETLQQTTAALSRLDSATLRRLLERLDAVQAGTLELEREPVAAVRTQHQVLAALLALTDRNIQVQQRSQERLQERLPERSRVR
jgi:hypothetical protein